LELFFTVPAAAALVAMLMTMLVSVLVAVLMPVFVAVPEKTLVIKKIKKDVSSQL
jgi:hypothetical protein